MNIGHLFQTFLSLSLTSVVTTVFVLLAGLILIKYLTRLFTNLLDRGGRLDASLRKLLSKAIRALLLFILIIICAGQLGLPITSLVTVLGAMGLAVSLALQDSLKNLAGGLFILSTKPFVTGHFIELGDVSGTVEEIGVIHTVLVTPDNRRIYVPNGTVSESTVINYSHLGTRRLELVFPVPYACDTAKAKAVVTAAIAADPRVHTDPAPLIRVWNLTATAVDIMVRAWTDSPNYWELRSSLLESVKIALDKNGISIPPNQMDVSIKTHDGT